MENWVRRVSSIAGGVIFGFLGYKLLDLILDFEFLWLIAVALGLFVTSAIDKSILESENSQMLHEKLTEDIKKIRKKKKKK